MSTGILTPAVDGARRGLLDRITRGELRGGSRLGAERDLAADLGVSRSTLRAALGVLEAQGVVRRVPGRGGGTFVTGGKVDRDPSRIVGLPALLRGQGFVAGTRVVGTATVGADAACAGALGLAEGALVLSVVRIRLADGEPLSLEHARLPALRFPGLLEAPLGGSLYDLLADRFAVVPTEGEERVEVALADAGQAALLGIAPGAPLLAVTRTTRDAAGVPFEFSRDLFRADRTLITVRTRGEATPSRSARDGGRLIELGG